MKANLPKVKFEVGKLEHMLPTINHFLNPKKGDWDWSKFIFGRYPALSKKLEWVKEKEKRKEIIKEFFKDFLSSNENILLEKSQNFQEEWDKINDDFMQILEEVLEIKWPKKDKVIKCFVGLNPICPREIKERNFDIFYDYSLEDVKAIAAHEILHFLWFEKWKEMFPKTPERNFDSPYLEWQLSEMVPKVILSDERIQKIFEHKPSVYKEYMMIKIKDKPLLKHIGKFYHDKKDIKDFIKKSWNFVKEHEKEINKD